MRPVPYSQLTPEQQAFAALPINRHVAGVGAPGSGKTLVLVHRAIRLIEVRGIDPKRILIVTYTNALESYIRAGLQEYGLPVDMVVSYDALMRRLHHELTGHRFEGPGGAKGDGFFNGQRDAVHQGLKDDAASRLFDMAPRWDAVLADEAQDLSSQDIETLVMLGRHVTVVMDGRQQLYRRGSTSDEVLAALGLRWESATFLSTFRCSRSVLAIASRIAESADDRRTLRKTVGTVGEEIPSMRVLAGDRDEEDFYLHQALKARTAAGRSCAVLLPTKRYVFGVAGGLREAGFAVDTQRGSATLGSSTIKVVTYHSAKGLSFDSVFLPRLLESQLRDVARHTVRGSLLFVALTRATTYLFMSAVAGSQAKEWAAFDDVDEGILQTVVTGESEPDEPVKHSSVQSVALEDFI